MNKSITGRHFELTEPIKAYADEAIDSLEKYHLDIISASTVISANEKQGKKGFAVEFIINLKDKNTIVITQGKDAVLLRSKHVKSCRMRLSAIWANISSTEYSAMGRTITVPSFADV